LELSEAIDDPVSFSLINSSDKHFRHNFVLLKISLQVLGILFGVYKNHCLVNLCGLVELLDELKLLILRKHDLKELNPHEFEGLSWSLELFVIVEEFVDVLHL